MSEVKFRLAEPADAEAFKSWVSASPEIDPRDVKAAAKKQNPSVLYFVAESPAGKVVAFAPVYVQYALAHLAFNPKANADERRQAMETLLNGVMAFAVQDGIREIVTLSKEEYPVAKWAMQHGFDLEPRQLLKFDINKVLAVAEEENKCAPVAEK